MEKEIKNWLEKGGFPLEMKFVDSLLKEEFEVSQSIFYQDSESGKFRETDIVASQFREINGIWTHITFVIECKKTSEKPWIILKNDGLLRSYEKERPVYHSKNGLNFLNSLYKNRKYKSDLFFVNDRSIGYSIQTVFNKGIDKSYEAVKSVTKACEYFSHKINERKNVCAFYFPVILIEGKLFEGNLTNNEIKIKEVNSSEVKITRSFHQYGNSCLMVFNNSNLDKMAQKLKKYSEDFFDNYNSLLIEKIGYKRDIPYG